MSLPEEITENIIDTKKYFERVEKTKLALRRFERYYRQYKYILPEEWSVNSFQDFINIFIPIFENKDLVNEVWFKEYHKLLFQEFLVEFCVVFNKYTVLQYGKGYDDFVLKVIKVVKHNLILPLSEMKRNVDRMC
tara:strand:+ start:127 stop:531 length:405 start_codon:yes stop_codon:yes gene_type:complete